MIFSQAQRKLPKLQYRTQVHILYAFYSPKVISPELSMLYY